jgi:predicted GH43/DUF377 family glycosyl hydrolase
MRWEKLGRVFVAEGQHDWMRTHAAWPRAVHLRGDVFRIFCSVRDGRSRSHVAFLDIDVNRPTEILALSESPVLSPGEAGSFDDAGVIPCAVVPLGSRRALYYAGLSLTAGDSYICLGGLADLDHDLGVATRRFPGPLLDQDEAQPLTGGSVWVVPQPARGTFHMWYESGVGEGLGAPGPFSRFAIKHAVSSDGVRWRRLHEVSIGDALERSYVSNPSVVIEGNTFMMWYSYKLSGRYRIGYADSADGVTWVLKDDSVGIEPSASGWDSEDVEYPSVFTHGRDLYMLYNGNQYGRTGFGLARRERS